MHRNIAISNNSLKIRQEITLYILIYIGCYRLLGAHSSTIVLQLRFITVFISLRQQFLAYQSHIKHEKQIGLTGRSLLEGQKVLKRYEDKKDSEYSFMNNAISLNLIPSQEGLNFLQISQGILIILLIVSSINIIQVTNFQGLLWYWLGVSCFIINMFTLNRQDKFFDRYKRLGIIILSSAFYLTLFYSIVSINTKFIIMSLSRNSINMFMCLFYDSIIPLHKRILNRKDLIFWMIWTNITSIITLFSLSTLSVSGDIIVALGCIIIGIISFFSYHIRKKYH